ncbi:MAG: ArsR family transcriptional regulator [Candidatus Methylacidiphilales bacterium]
MLDALITSKTRIKLLLKFFLNSNNRDYLRGLESEFGDSSNSIRQELNKLETAGLLESNSEGNKKIFNANTKHPLFPEIKSILMKFTGLDQLIIHVIDRLGDVNEVYLIGDLGRGIESELIDLVFVGNIDRDYLNQLISKAEKHIKKKIRYVYYSLEEFSSKKDKIISSQDLLLWKAG